MEKEIYPVAKPDKQAEPNLDRGKLSELIKDSIQTIIGTIERSDIDFGRIPDGASGTLESWRNGIIARQIEYKHRSNPDLVAFTKQILEQLKELSLEGFNKVYKASENEKYEATEEDIILAGASIANDLMWHKLDWDPREYSSYASKFLEKHYPRWAKMCNEDKEKFLEEVIDALAHKKLPRIKEIEE